MDGAHWGTEAISLFNKNLVSVNDSLDIEIKIKNTCRHISTMGMKSAPTPNTEFKENRMANGLKNIHGPKEQRT
jgi:hypothetical protein